VCLQVSAIEECLLLSSRSGTANLILEAKEKEREKVAGSDSHPRKKARRYAPSSLKSTLLNQQHGLVDQAVRLTLNHHLRVQSQSPPHLRQIRVRRTPTQVQARVPNPHVRENVTEGDVFLGGMTAGVVPLPHPVPQVVPMDEIDSDLCIIIHMVYV
jgi:hypothetical protein